MAPASSAAALAAVLVALQLSAVVVVAAADAHGCTRKCGDVGVPYPFGVVGDPGGAGCYLPGLNLTCDHDPPRLLLGDGTLQVVEISLDNATVRVVRAGDIKMYDYDSGTLGGGLKVHGTYSLSAGNELIVTGCNVMAALYEETSHVIMSACASFCPVLDAVLTGLGMGYEDAPGKYCNGKWCCQAPIAAVRDAATSYVKFKWFGHNISADQESVQASAHVFVAEEGWLDSYDSAVEYPLSKDTVPVPMLLGWEIVDVDPSPSTTDDTNGWWQTQRRECPGRVATSICKSNKSTCIQGRGYRCYCEDGYQGNPYMLDGCKG